MAQSTVRVRMDENLKREFDALCADFGMSAATAFNVFARAVVRERGIPFLIQASDAPTRPGNCGSVRQRQIDEKSLRPL